MKDGVPSMPTRMKSDSLVTFTGDVVLRAMFWLRPFKVCVLIAVFAVSVHREDYLCGRTGVNRNNSHKQVKMVGTRAMPIAT